MLHRRLASPLHAARAGAASAFCAALGGAALATRHPLLLAALLVAVVLAGRLAGVGPELRRAARLAVPLALLIALINPLVVRDGLTVLARLGELPYFGRIDLTLEALVYGVTDGLRVLVVVLACALFSSVVDPDALLRGLRRISSRTALTAVVATRLVPVLAADARRLEEARRCRPDAGGGAGPGAQLAVLRAVTTGALDRALDVAATLEVRGYGASASAGPGGLLCRTRHAGLRQQAPRSRERWSRHDRNVLAAALALTGVPIVAALTGAATFAAYPRLDVPFGPVELALSVAVLLLSAAPFAERRGIA